MKKIISLSTILFLFLAVSAQITPKPLPGTQPGKVTLPTPKIPPLKPDIEYVDSHVVSVHEDVSRHLFEITLSITLRNNGGGATPTGFYLDLQGKYDTRQGGTAYSIIGAKANVHTLAAGETRTVEFVFAKDVTSLGRGTHSCILRMDCTNLIAESNEDNNNSPSFDIVMPAAP